MTTPQPIEYADAPRSAARNSDLQDDTVIGTDDLPVLIGRAVTINRPQPEVYARWRDLSQLHCFMAGVQQVIVKDARHARLVIGDSASDQILWDLEVFEDESPRLIAWRMSQDGKPVHEGKVEFSVAAGARGTVVTATLAVKSGGGTLRALWARLFHRDPRVHAQRELRRFKQWVETGEVSTSTPPAAAPRASKPLQGYSS